MDWLQTTKGSLFDKIRMIEMFESYNSVMCHFNGASLKKQNWNLKN